MHGYELGLLTTNVTINTIAAELRATTRSMYVREIGIFLNAATATTLGLGRAANVTGVGGTVNLGQTLSNDDEASVNGVVLSGQSTAPTAPTLYHRQIALPGAIGNGMVWVWEDPGFRIKLGTALVLVNVTASSALRLYVRWEE